MKRPLTNFEKIAHDQSLKKFNDKQRKIKEKFCAGDITLKKMNKDLNELKTEQLNYTRESGIILFFGKLFMVKQ